VFALDGHEWPMEPGRKGTDLLGSVQVGGLEAITIDPVGGAGGRDGLPGDYVYGDHREPYRDAGMWGIFRVACASPGLRALPGPADRGEACTNRRAGGTVSDAAVVLLLAAVVAVSLRLLSRRRRGSAVR
jgi:hypothetical protein